MKNVIGHSKVEPSTRDAHPWYERVLTGTSVSRRYVDVGPGGRVHVLENGTGSPLVLLHGSGVAAGFFLPLLERLDGLRALAPDRPGHGLSNPVAYARSAHRASMVAWVDSLLDALGLEKTALLGHSAGGLCALWYALAHPDRVERLVMVAPPALPGTRCPLPYRMLATPWVREALGRLVPPSPKAALRFAKLMGEGDTLSRHPDLVDLFVLAGRDPIAASALEDEVRALVSPFALVEPSGFRRLARVRPEELRRLSMPVLLIWGTREPLGSPSVAQAVSDLIPEARLVVLPVGHGPWLGEPERTAAEIAGFVR